MRIVFVNIHGNEMLLKTMDKMVFRHSCAIKHGYLLKFLLSNPQYEVCSYINDRGFSLMHNGSKSLLSVLNLFRYLEHKFVLRKNGISRKKVKILKKLSDIQPDDIVLLYRHHGEQLRHMEEVSSFKAVSMIHFWGKRDEAVRLHEIKVDCYLNESNLEKNSEIFRRFYTDSKWIVHPFVYENRFENKRKFTERLNKAFATGTITYKEDDDFLSVYHNSCDQPSRKQILDNAEFFKDYIDCYSSDYHEEDGVKQGKETDNVIQRFYKKLYNRIHSGQQKKYYSFDMVEKFNEYKMCIVGEEILGVPGIGFVEGMACGCAYIGLDSPMYIDLGLIPGVHYITYDGTVDDLKRVIEYYQMDEHQAELEQIAKTGCEYVRANFNGNMVAKNLLEKLEEQQKQWKEERRGEEKHDK